MYVCSNCSRYIEDFINQLIPDTTYLYYLFCEQEPVGNVMEVLVPPVYFQMMGRQVGVDEAKIRLMEPQSDSHPSLVTLQTD